MFRFYRSKVYATHFKMSSSHHHQQHHHHHHQKQRHHHHHHHRSGTDLSSSSGGGGGGGPYSTPCRCAVELINGTVLFTAVVLGVVKNSMCPVEPFIPKALAGVGLAGTMLILADKGQLCCEERGVARRVVAPFIKFILVTVAFVSIICIYSNWC